jgi:DNA-binding transcriptional ArsR family regulator
MPFEIELEHLSEIVREYAPELADLWIIRKDDFEEEGIRTGRLHENHILGIILGQDFLNEKRITTQEIESHYEKYFKKIARSTVSTYLNQLDKEGVLGKERDGRIVFYYLKEAPPESFKPFWIVRNFYVLPAFFMRAQYLSRFYQMKANIPPDLIESRKFIVGLALLTIFRNRFDKCILCQFASKEGYRELKDVFDTIIKDRKDVLPEALQSFIERDLGELPMFGGLNIPEKVTDGEINTRINDYVERYAQDIDFQMNVSKRRQELRLKQKHKLLHEEEKMDTNTKVTNIKDVKEEPVKDEELEEE